MALVTSSRRPVPAALRAVLLVLAWFLAASPAATRAQSPTSISVALDWYPNANHAGLYLAQERGYFASASLAVDLYTPADPTVVLQTVGAGRDTFGISYQTDLLLARAEGVPVVSVAALVQRPLLGVMVLADSGIERPRDLVGRSVGYPGIPSQEAFLATMLEADGARLEDVELVNVGFDLVPAVIAGRVDAVMGAYWTHETILAARAGYAVDLMRVDDWGVPPYYELVLVAGEETVREQPEMVRRFVEAMQRGYLDAMADPEAALAALAAASPELDLAVEAEGLALLPSAWLVGGLPFGAQSPERWHAYAAWMVARGLIPADLDVAAAYTGSPLLVSTGTPEAFTRP